MDNAITAKKNHTSWCDACKRADLEGSVNLITAKLQLQTASEAPKLNNQSPDDAKAISNYYFYQFFCSVYSTYALINTGKIHKKSMKSYVKQEKYLIQDIFSSTTYVRLILKCCLKDVKTFSL